jgi:hypothetical protein
MERKSISEQARVRGVEVPVGLTVAEIRDLGFTVDAAVPSHAVLQVDNDDPSWTRPEGQVLTGYVFVWVQPFLDTALEELAKEEDAKFREACLKGIDGK